MKKSIRKLFGVAIATIVILNLALTAKAQNNTSWTTFTNNGMGGSKQLEFGYGVAGKEPNAGKIGYQTWTPGYLEIMGAGTLGTNRKIKFYNEGGALFTGSVNIEAASNPSFRIGNPIGSLEIGIASCNGCYSSFAIPGNVVIRPSQTIAGPKKMIFSTNSTVGSGGSFEFNSESHRILSISDNNYVVIGDPATITFSPPFPGGYKLYVTDGILTEKVKIALKTTSDWSDFVFASDYKLMPLTSVATFIKENKHLPDVPSAEELVTSGIDLGKMDAKLLQKIEELTLYMIELEKKVEDLERKLESKK